MYKYLGASDQLFLSVVCVLEGFVWAYKCFLFLKNWLYIDEVSSIVFVDFAITKLVLQ
jgi:hypothetical protein